MSQHLHRIFALATWLTFPLMFSFLFPLATRLALVLAWIATAVWALVTQRAYFHARLGLSATVLVLAYFGYVAAIVVATSIHPSGLTLRGLVMVLVKLAYGVFLWAVLTPNLLKVLWALYVRVITYFTAGAIMLTLLLAAALNPPLLGVYEQTTAGEDTREIAIYPLGFGLATVPGLSFPLYRLQSFSDEPGSFAMAILPAIYWSVFVQRKRSTTAILVIGLALTFSFGAAICVATVILLYLMRSLAFTSRRVAWIGLGTITLSLSIAYLVASPPAWLMAYLIDKLGATTQSSGGARVQQLRIAFDLLRQFPEGVGAGVAMNEADSPIAIGLMKAVAEAGIIGGASYLLAFAILAWLAARTIRRSHTPASVALGASVLSNLLMSLQRMQADQSFWHFFVLTTFLFAVHSPFLAGKPYPGLSTSENGV